MERFYGSFEYSLDAKGRVILPARLRSPFEGKRALISCYVDKCLAVWTPDEFEHFLAKAEAMESRGPEGRSLARALTAMSADVEFDGQWRLSIPGHLREWAGLRVDSPVMITGAGKKVELWQVDHWRESMAPALESLADGNNALFFEPDQPAARAAGGGL